MGEMRRILVAGGGGLVGGRLAEHLTGAGFRVRLGTRDVHAGFRRPLGVEVVCTEWSDEGRLREICRDVDVVVNAMGMNAGDCVLDPVAALMVNGIYTASLLRAAVTVGVRRFVHLSTAHVYGSPLQGKVSESTCPSNLHPYATTHRSGEEAVLWADRQGDIEGVVLRLSNAYGRPLDPQTRCWTLLVNDLCRQAVEKRGLTLRSDGLQHRDFIPLSSVCGLIGRLCGIDSVASVKSEAGAPSLFNVGSGTSMSVASMAKLIQSRCESVLGYRVKLVKQPSHEKEEGLSLRYVSENLDQSMIKDGRDNATEIDELLLFCREHFRG